MGNSVSSRLYDQSSVGNSIHPSSVIAEELPKPFSTNSPKLTGLDPILNLRCENIDVDAIIRGIWAFIFAYTDGSPPVYHSRPILAMLRDAEELLEAEKTVLELPSPQCIVGDLHGQGDTLITLLSLADTPPSKSYVFLGNYGGQGFAPHETLFLLLALKVKYPFNVYLLKGNLEDPEMMKAHGFISGLTQRNLMQNAFVWMALERIFTKLPLAAVIDNRYFCVHGGIGPELMRGGISQLRKVERPAVMPWELALTLECQWACLRSEASKGKLSALIPEMLNDGSPLFSESDVEEFCRRNSIQGIIRSRQLVNDGVLNLPLHMLTVWSAVSYLDNFRNMAAVLVVDANSEKISIIRYRQVDMEPESLDDKKPIAGRNAMNI